MKNLKQKEYQTIEKISAFAESHVYMLIPCLIILFAVWLYYAVVKRVHIALKRTTPKIILKRSIAFALAVIISITGLSPLGKNIELQTSAATQGVSGVYYRGGSFTPTLTYTQSNIPSTITEQFVCIDLTSGSSAINKNITINDSVKR